MDVGDVGQHGHRLDRQVVLGGRAGDAVAVEAARRDAYDGDGLGVDPEGGADDGGVSCELMLPGIVAHDGGCRSALEIVGVGEDSTCVCVNTEGAEVVS